MANLRFLLRILPFLFRLLLPFCRSGRYCCNRCAFCGRGWSCTKWSWWWLKDFLVSTLGKWSVLTTPDTQNHHIWQEIPFKNPWFRVSIGSKNTDIFHHHSDVLRLEDFRVGLSEPQNVMGKPSIWPKAKRHVVWPNSCFQQVLMTPLNLKHLFPKKMFFFLDFPRTRNK